ncbi:hypothetical protein C2U68_04205 [Methylomonas koyamae]|nr:hypothetical protein C2U68_04205 [Methylomonas koyamae]
MLERESADFYWLKWQVLLLPKAKRPSLRSVWLSQLKEEQCYSYAANQFECLMLEAEIYED